MMERISVEEFHGRLKAQGVSAREHVALKCPICGTVQSFRNFTEAGVEIKDAESRLGFSCIGRITGAGPHKPKAKPGLGCDWTLGGLFTLHKLEVVTEDGKAHPRFEVASPEEAQALEASWPAKIVA